MLHRRSVCALLRLLLQSSVVVVVVATVVFTVAVVVVVVVVTVVFGRSTAQAHGGVNVLAAAARLGRKARNRWSRPAAVVQASIGVLRALGVAIYTPWIMQRGPPKATTARRVMHGLLAASAIDVATTAAVRGNVVALDVRQALSLLQRRCVRACVRACVRVCVRAWQRAWPRAWPRACVAAFAPTCVSVRVCVRTLIRVCVRVGVGSVGCPWPSVAI